MEYSEAQIRLRTAVREATDSVAMTGRQREA